MFLHRVKMNWKKHQTLTFTILLVALARIVLESAFGEAPSSVYAFLQIGVRVLIVMAAWAFLKTCWELGTLVVNGDQRHEVLRLGRNPAGGGRERAALDVGADVPRLAYVR